MRHVTVLVKVDLYETSGTVAMLLDFRRAAQQQGVPQNEIDAVLDDCTAGDYEHLVAVLFENTER